MQIRAGQPAPLGRSTEFAPAATRRDLLRVAAAAGSGLALSGAGSASGAPSPAPAHGAAAPARRDEWFKISLAQWSFHRALRRPAEEGGFTNLEFPSVARERCGIDAIEYVNAFFRTRGADGKETPRGTDFGYLEDLRGARRRDAVENHFKWVAAAAYLRCHAIRVNAGGQGPREAQAERAADSLRRIARVSRAYDISVIVENHGGLSSDGAWLADVMRRADDEFVGTLPDFGNFYDYDRYQGVADLMPFAKAVSAKSYAFGPDGRETKIDYARMLKIVRDAGYRGHVGIEYEGGDADEAAGIAATKALLERVRAELA